MATLFDRPSRFGKVPPKLATPRVPSRNDLLAERERLAREEREAAARLDGLRDRLDEIGNRLAEPPPPPEKDPAALFMVNHIRARQGLPPLTELPPMPPQPKAQKINPTELAKQIIRAGKRARGEKDD
jgi:hypothetical protein